MTLGERTNLRLEWDPVLSRCEQQLSGTGNDKSRRAAPVLRWPGEAVLGISSDPAVEECANEIDRPDFAIRFARRFVEACRQGLVPRRRMLGLQRGGSCLHWISSAVTFLQRSEDRVSGRMEGLSPPQLAVGGAIAIDRDPRLRGLLQRLLIARNSDAGKVARVLEMDAEAVAAWQALFFDFGDREAEPFRFFAVLNAPAGGDEGDGGLPPLIECACLDLQFVILHCGVVDGGHGKAAGELLQESGDFEEVISYLVAWRELLLHSNAYPLNSRSVGNAQIHLKKVEAELRKQPIVPMYSESFKAAVGHGSLKVQEEPHPEAESKPEPELTRLTIDELRMTCDLWNLCAEVKAQGGFSSCSLKPLLRRSDQSVGTGIPLEMSRPDFGALLAQRVAASGRSGQLPEDKAFHWIRLMADELVKEAPGGRCGRGDADRHALRRAMELHASRTSRQLLQATLVMSGAEIPEVADFLRLDARVVDAYATLYYNLPGRRRESSYRLEIERRIKDGRDPLGGGRLPPDRGFTAVMRVVPDLTLDDFQHIMGFRAWPDQAAHAAFRFLQAVDRQARRGGMREGVGKTGAAVSGGHRGDVQFESALRRAAKRINAHDLGPAHSHEGVFKDPNYIRSFAKARESNRLQVIDQMRKDAGLTEEEAMSGLQLEPDNFSDDETTKKNT